MKRITNNKTDRGYRFSAGRQSKKISVDVTRVGSRWTMTLPSGERYDRKSIAELKPIFAKHVEARYAKPKKPVAVKPVKPKTPKRCSNTDCSNPPYFEFTTCLSCHYAG